MCLSIVLAKTASTIKKWVLSGGGRGIRTPEGLPPQPAFQASALSHSAIPPHLKSDGNLADRLPLCKRFIKRIYHTPVIACVCRCPGPIGPLTCIGLKIVGSQNEVRKT